MNERIKELISQAQKEVWDNSPYNGSPEFVGYELDTEKFAELIVVESANLCFARAAIMLDRNEESDNKLINTVKALTLNIAGECIKDHFGITE